MTTGNPLISVVCPFYNESVILEASVDLMIANLSRMTDTWELIIVNDGSTDGSFAIAQKLKEKYGDRLTVTGYPQNRGRGFAIRTGAAQARGTYLVTTEIDSSWGDNIAAELTAVLKENPAVDMVIASPNLPGGGYKNVPEQRVRISRWGNKVIRLCLSTGITMYTGMTRGYKLDKFLALPLDEDEKEMHLEVARKALALGYVIAEIPALLTWKHDKLAAPKAKGKWKSSARIAKLMRTHLWFSLLAAPFRYLIGASAVFLLVSFIFGLLGFINFFTQQPSVYYILTGLLMAVLGVLTFGLAILSRQTIESIHEMWRVRMEIRLFAKQEKL